MDAEAHELIAGYALDSLDEADQARAKELLATSEEAREELRSLTEVASALATAAAGPTPRPELRQRILDETPLGRGGTPRDTAALVSFLLSPEGGWVNGQLLHSDGGLHA